MVKAKKILFLIAGILKCVLMGFITLFSLIFLMTYNIIKQVFLTSYEIIGDVVKDLVNDSSEFAFLLDYSKEAQVDYFMGIFRVFFLLALLFAIFGIILGVMNILISKKIGYIKMKKSNKILLIVLSWVLNLFDIINNTLTTVAVCLSDKDKSSEDVIEIQTDN